MKLRLLRTKFLPDRTLGWLSVDGTYECFTLEPPVRPEKPCAIPPGTYPVVVRYSPKFGRDVPHIDFVPGFDAVEIHIGNFPHDTEGCVLVGRALDSHYDLSHSTVAWDSLMEHLAGQTDVAIEIGPPNGMAAAA